MDRLFWGQVLLRSGASARSLTSLNVSRLDGITRAALELNPRVRRQMRRQAGRLGLLCKVLRQNLRHMQKVTQSLPAPVLGALVAVHVHARCLFGNCASASAKAPPQPIGTGDL